MAEEQIRRRSDRYKDEIEVEDVEETKEIKVIKKEPKKVPEQKEQKTILKRTGLTEDVL